MPSRQAYQWLMYMEPDWGEGLNPCLPRPEAGCAPLLLHRHHTHRQHYHQALRWLHIPHQTHADTLGPLCHPYPHMR